jgi:hypothetical protein
MDAFGQGFKVGVERADDDSGMVGASPVKMDKMLFIESHACPFLIACESQDFFVRYRLTPDFPASCELRVSCPRRFSSSITGSGKFSFA